MSARRVAVAVSGGRDSMALLHCTLRAAEALGIEVLALHVHHGLQPAADAWAEFVQRTCRRWAAQGRPLRFAMQRLAGRPPAGDSVEAWARRGRYAALAAMARESGAHLVLLAHHQRDQAETFVLQALRGAGPAGLAAMPQAVERDGLVWARPWLQAPKEAIDAYARRHRLRAVDDPSNADPRHARSRLRLQVMPALRQAFADAEPQLAAAAARSAEAQAVLDELAQSDLATAVDGNALRLAPWRALSPARQRNALRAWLRVQMRQGAPQSLVERLMRELAGSAPASWPCGDITLRRYRGRLLVAPTEPPALAQAIAAREAVAEAITGPGWYAVPGHTAALRVAAVEQGGVAWALLAQARWRARSGGERFQRAPGTSPRSLKKQFQAAGMPAWQRTAPLLFSADGQLLFVPGLGIDARALAACGAPQATLSWRQAGSGPGSGAARQR